MANIETNAPEAPAIPWVERYRPKSLSEVSHQTEIISTLKNAIETNRLPHLLFYGPPGTGKTSVALALCRQLWHPSQFKRRVLELNASDERGISIVRNKIKHFASLAVGTVSEKGYPNPPFKIIILDEADTVTPDAQAALRRVIEAHSKITRFILICNYVTRIIEPVASRCAKFRFQPLPPLSMINRLREISTAEHCKYEDDADGPVLNEILKLSQGDMRRAVTILQSVQALSMGGAIKWENVAEMSGLPPENVIQPLLQSLTSKSFDSMEQAVSNVIAEGYAAQYIIGALLQRVVLEEDSKIDDIGRAKLSIKIAETDKKLMDGADDYLQLISVCSLVVRLLNENAP